MVARTALAAGIMACALMLGSGPAWSACALKTYPITVTMDRMKPTIAAKVNGQDVRFMVDSGAFFNAIAAKFAFEQKMKAAQVDQTGSHLQAEAATTVTGAGGTEKVSALVRADQFVVAGAAFKNVTFLTLGSGFGDVAGILGQNFLSLTDVEYDLGHGSIHMVQPQDCKDATLAYWAPGAPFSMLPLESNRQDNGVAIGMVLINGVKMRAVFDTGASLTFVTQRAAARAGVKTSDPGVKSIGTTAGVDRTDIKTWIAPFADIKIGDEEIKNGLLTIGDSSALDFDVLVGADFFLSHHVYVANSQHKLYFTYNGGPVFSLPGVRRAAGREAATQVGSLS